MAWALTFQAPPPPTAHKLTKITTSRKSTPASASNTATPQEQRMALGIVDNEDGDWEDEEDDDE